jgi:hypothetical protein
MKAKMRNTIVNGGMSGTDSGINRIFAYRNGKSYSQVRKRVTQRASNTELQQQVRNAFANSSQSWSQLTEEERTAYNLAAPSFQGTDQFGTTTPSGKNLRTATVIVLDVAGMDATTIAPSTTLLGDIASSNLETNGQFTVDYDCTNENPSERLQIAISKPLSAGTYAKAKTKLLKTLAFTIGAHSVDVASEYEALYGPLANLNTKKVSWEIYHVSEFGYKKRISVGTTVIEGL